MKKEGKDINSIVDVIKLQVKKMMRKLSARFRKSSCKNASTQHHSRMNEYHSTSGNYVPPIVKATHDFTATDQRQLSFRKGDQLEIKAKSWQDWWLAQRVVTRETGYVPVSFIEDASSSQSKEWFYANMSRQESENLLKTSFNRPGAFLIRNSQAGHGLTLSIRVARDINKDGQVEHYRVHLSSGSLFYIKTSRTFMTLNDIVDFYLSSHPENDLRGIMTHPCKKSKADIPNLTIEDQWEIDPKDLQRIETLGEGNYGTVWRGTWRNMVTVAIKMLKVQDESLSIEAFMKEASVMKNLRHENILILYGVCSQRNPRLIVTEFMSEGSLIDVLQSRRGRRMLQSDLLHISLQVANAMTYLENKRLVHRDLSARNVLIGEALSCKVADFGLARMLTGDEYNSSSDIKLPIRWLAPETFRQVFTVKSDVWAFAVLLTEIFTYGQQPYSELSNEAVIASVKKGYRMQRPQACPFSLYQLMLDCWHDNMEKRPTFAHIYDFLMNFNIGKAIYV